MEAGKLKVDLEAYWSVTKPRIVYLLVFTAMVAMLVAARSWALSLERLLLATLAVALGSAGSNTVTGYIDRDIDGTMSRTRLRPIPSGRIAPAERALHYGLIMIGLSLALAYRLNLLSAALMALAVFDNVVVYSLWLKRRSPSNIVLGGLSGGMPVLIGYSAVSGAINLEALLMALIVILWIPPHIWSLALRCQEDYVRAKVPMLPVVVDERVAARFIALASVLMVAFTALPHLFQVFGEIYLYTALLLGGIMLALSMWLMVEPTKKKAWTVFKFSSPYLTLLFAAMALDTLLR